MKYIISTLLVVFAASFNACIGQEPNTIRILPVQDYSVQIQRTVPLQLIDVRTPDEYAQGHLPQAENVNVLAEDFEERISSYDKEQPIYIYCQSGNRSKKAAAKLAEMGFTQIFDLQGGFKNWTGAIEQ